MIIVSGRKMLVPHSERLIGFEGDNLVETRLFAITDKQLFDMDFVADFGEDRGCAVLEKRHTEDGEMLVLKLDITSALVKESGTLAYQLRGVDTQGTRRWHSEVDTFTVSRSFESENEVTEEQMSELHQLERSAFEHSNNAKTYCDEALDAANECKSSLAVATYLARDVQTLHDETEEYCNKAEEFSELLSDGTAVKRGISENSAVQNGSNISGCYGMRIVGISTPELIDGVYYAQYTLDGEAAYEKGDVVSIRLDANYDMCGEIDGVSGNVVTVRLYKTDINALPTTLDADSTGDKNSLRVPLKPDVGNVDIGINAAAFGGGNIASGAYSFASGNGCKALGRYAFAEGYGTQAGYMSHAEGNLTQALNESHAEGYKTVSEGENSHAEGSSSVAVGQNSHAEGTQTQAVGASSHAEGYNAKAEGAYSHAEGAGQNGGFVIASGTASHAEGRNTKSSGNYSHAEGSSTIASGESSHAEGTSVQAVGQNSHAEGVNTYASGRCAHAEGGGADGVWSYATAPFSHAEGKCVNASSEAQHVQGRYNVPDSKGVYAHIVGGGTSGSDRKNIHTLDWNGNAWFKGDVYTGGTQQSEGKKLATEEFVTDALGDIDTALDAILAIQAEYIGGDEV